MIIFDSNDPLVLDGTYDTEGYKPGERARIAKAKLRQEQIEAQMAKKTKSKPNGRGRSSAPAPAPKKRRTPRQPDLPGTEDRAIAELEDAADTYAETRDQRMALTVEETGLKATILRLMKAHKKTTYHRNGVSIEIVAEEETVKVRVKKTEDDDGDDEAADETHEAEA